MKGSWRWDVFVIAFLSFIFAVEQPSYSHEQNNTAGTHLKQQDITVDGLDRTFFYHLPKGYSNNPTPLVFYFHGGGGYAVPFATNVHAVTTADQNNFIAVAPQGYDIPSHWNYGVKVKGKQNHDDVKFVNHMIDYMQAHFNIDPRRIYICGYSDGGWFTQWLTYQIPNKIAGAGVVCALETIESQQTFGDGHPHLPVVFMLGTSDPRMVWPVTPNGTNVISADATIHSWVFAEHCVFSGRKNFPDVSTSDNSHVEATYYWDREPRPEVVFYRVIGGGHTWPGAVDPNSQYGNVNEDIDATQELWDFFKARPKQVLNEPAPFPRLTLSSN